MIAFNSSNYGLEFLFSTSRWIGSSRGAIRQIVIRCQRRGSRHDSQLALHSRESKFDRILFVDLTFPFRLERSYSLDILLPSLSSPSSKERPYYNLGNLRESFCQSSISLSSVPFPCISTMMDRRLTSSLLTGCERLSEDSSPLLSSSPLRMLKLPSRLLDIQPAVILLEQLLPRLDFSRRTPTSLRSSATRRTQLSKRRSSLLDLELEEESYHLNSPARDTRSSSSTRECTFPRRNCLVRRFLVLFVPAFAYPASHLIGTPAAGFRDLYENNGLMASEDGSINILAGSTWGGGTTVNWSASLIPQHFVRQEWATKNKLPHFLTKEFTDSIDFVCHRMGVSPAAVVHSKPNALLIDASLKLGYHASTIPQNTNGSQHSCGFCSFGCTFLSLPVVRVNADRTIVGPYGEKQGGTVTWLRDAAEHGAKFIQEATVDRLLFATSLSAKSPTEATLAQYTPTSSRNRVIGALIKSADGKIAILRATKAVVVSAGSLNSPAILLRSGLKGSRIGKNLHLHPVS